MIFRRNIKRTTGSAGTFYTFLCLGLAALFFIGDVSAQTQKTPPSGEASPQTRKKVSDLFSGFRLKSKSEPKKDAGTKPSPKVTAIEKQAKVESQPVPTSQVKPENVEKAVEDEKNAEQNKSSTAPLPPEISYFEKSRLSVDNPSQSVDAAPAAKNAQSAPVVSSERQMPVRQEEQTIASLSSYSFDSRDWVEHFPVEHCPVEQRPVERCLFEHPVESDSFSTNQTTTVSNTNARSAPPTSSLSQAAVTAEDSSSNEWNGAAMPLKTDEDRNLKFASVNRDITLPAKHPETVSAGIDLTPSYLSRLKYSEVCGVVVVQSNFPLAEIRPILEEIKLLQRDLNLYMGVPAPKEKIELCLFRDESSYTRFLRDVFPKAPRDRRALYIKLDNKPGTLLVQRTEEFEIDLRHEMTHAIIHASIRDVPIWLDEGLAKYFEVPVQDRAEKNPYMKTIRRNANFGGVPILSRLEKLEHIGHMGAREYRDSWAWVHFMIHHSPQTHRLLAGYLQMLSTLLESTGSSVRIPPLGPYLKDVLENPRESYREHFQSWSVE